MQKIFTLKYLELVILTFLVNTLNNRVKTVLLYPVSIAAFRVIRKKVMRKYSPFLIKLKDEIIKVDR
jgi:hypothetical protein